MFFIALISSIGLCGLVTAISESCLVGTRGIAWQQKGLFLTKITLKSVKKAVFMSFWSRVGLVCSYLRLKMVIATVESITVGRCTCICIQFVCRTSVAKNS